MTLCECTSMTQINIKTKDSVWLDISTLAEYFSKAEWQHNKYNQVTKWRKQWNENTWILSERERERERSLIYISKKQSNIFCLYLAILSPMKFDPCLDKFTVVNKNKTTIAMYVV